MLEVLIKLVWKSFIVLQSLCFCIEFICKIGLKCMGLSSVGFPVIQTMFTLFYTLDQGYWNKKKSVSERFLSRNEVKDSGKKNSSINSKMLCNDTFAQIHDADEAVKPLNFCSEVTNISIKKNLFILILNSLVNGSLFYYPLFSHELAHIWFAQQLYWTLVFFSMHLCEFKLEVVVVKWQWQSFWRLLPRTAKTKVII